MDELPSNWLGFLVAEGEAAIPPTSIGATLLKLFAVLILVGANGFFVAAEFALVGLRPSRIETMAAAGSRSAKRLLEVLKSLNSYLSACQLGITLASLALGWIGEPAPSRDGARTIDPQTDTAVNASSGTTSSSMCRARSTSSRRTSPRGPVSYCPTGTPRCGLPLERGMRGRPSRPSNGKATGAGGQEVTGSGGDGVSG